MNMNTIFRFVPRALLLSAGVALSGCSHMAALGIALPGTALTARQQTVPIIEQARRAFLTGNYGIAISLLEQELAVRPASIAALNGLGASYDRLGRHTVARRYFYRALELDPASSLTLNNLGYSHLLEGNAEAADKMFQLALQHDGSNPVTLANREPANARISVDPPAAVVIQAVEPVPAAVVVTGATAPQVAEMPQAARLDSDLRVEVSNGNGVNGMAARMREFLRGQGGKVVRLTNADAYHYKQTVIKYRQGRRTEAEALAALLPLANVILEQTDQLAGHVDARLLAGRDLLAFDNMLLAGGRLAQLAQ